MLRESNEKKILNQQAITEAFNTLSLDLKGYKSENFILHTDGGTSRSNLILRTNNNPLLYVQTALHTPSHILFKCSTRGDNPTTLVEVDVRTNRLYEGLGIGGALFTLINQCIELLIEREKYFCKGKIIGIIDDVAYAQDPLKKRRGWSSYWASQLGYLPVSPDATKYPKGFESEFMFLAKNGRGWNKYYRE